MLLGWQVVLQEVASLWLLQITKALFTTADLDGVAAVLLDCLYLCDLAPVDLNDSAWHELSPLVPEVSHADLIADQTSPLTVSVLWCCLL